MRPFLGLRLVLRLWTGRMEGFFLKHSLWLILWLFSEESSHAFKGLNHSFYFSALLFCIINDSIVPFLFSYHVLINYFGYLSSWDREEKKKKEKKTERMFDGFWRSIFPQIKTRVWWETKINIKKKNSSPSEMADILNHQRNSFLHSKHDQVEFSHDRIFAFFSFTYKFPL